MTDNDETDPREVARLGLEVLPRLGHLIASTIKLDEPGFPSVTQFRVLKHLACRPWRVSELAQAMRYSAPTVSVAVDSLVRRGLVERREATDDRRANPLTLTSEGTRWCDAAQEHALSALGEILEQIPAEERAALAKGLAAVGRALDAAVSQNHTHTAADSNSKGLIP